MTSLRSTLAPAEIEDERRLHLTQGQFKVSGDADVVLMTTLGSCVAACLHDPVARVGGMNHFLLPEGSGPHSAVGSEAMRYGAYAMEVLVNALLRAGGRRDRLQGKLFGGARLSGRLADIGGDNVAFAETFLRREGISYLGGSVRGQSARRIQYWPECGRARQLFLERSVDVMVELERGRTLAHRESGAVDWFED